MVLLWRVIQNCVWCTNVKYVVSHLRRLDSMYSMCFTAENSPKKENQQKRHRVCVSERTRARARARAYLCKRTRTCFCACVCVQLRTWVRTRAVVHVRMCACPGVCAYVPSVAGVESSWRHEWLRQLRHNCAVKTSFPRPSIDGLITDNEILKRLAVICLLVSVYDRLVLDLSVSVWQTDRYRYKVSVFIGTFCLSL